MLKLETTHRQSSRPPEEDANFLPQLDLLSILRLFSCHWPRFILVMIAVVVLALAYQVTAKRRYSSTFSILVSVKDRDILATDADTGSTDKIVDPGAIESEVEIVKSSEVLLESVRKLNLTENEAFMNAGASPFLKSLRWSSRRSNPPWVRRPKRNWSRMLSRHFRRFEGQARRRDLCGRGDLHGSRSRTDPFDFERHRQRVSEQRAQSALRQFSTPRPTGFRDRLLELRKDASTADLSVQRYKIPMASLILPRAHRRIATLGREFATLRRPGHDRGGESEARSCFGRTERRFANAAVSDAMKSDVITRLRAQYLDLSSKQAELIQRYGKEHQVVHDLGRQMGDIAAAAKEELKRIAQPTEATTRSRSNAKNR